MIELLVLAIGLARLLPKFVRASNDVHFGWLRHFLLSSGRATLPDAGLESKGKVVQATTVHNGLAT